MNEKTRFPWWLGVVLTVLFTTQVASAQQNDGDDEDSYARVELLRLDVFAQPNWIAQPDSNGYDLRSQMRMFAAPGVTFQRRWRIAAALTYWAYDLQTAQGDVLLQVIMAMPQLTYVGEKSCLFLQAGPGLLGELTNISSRDQQFQAFGYGCYSPSETLTLKGGAGFLHGAGLTLPLPLLGVTWAPTDNTVVDVMLPISARIDYNLNDHFGIFGLAELDSLLFDVEKPLGSESDDFLVPLYARIGLGASIGLISGLRGELALGISTEGYESLIEVDESPGNARLNPFGQLSLRFDQRLLSR